MSHRFFYIGPGKVALRLQDAFRRAKQAKLTSEQLSCFNIAPGVNEQDRLNASTFKALVRELWDHDERNILFYDEGFDNNQEAELRQRLKDSKVVFYPVRRPSPDLIEECNRTALMMMSTPLWTKAYVHQSFSPEEALLHELDRLGDENQQLRQIVASTSSAEAIKYKTLGVIVAEIKSKHHPKLLVITDLTEKTAKTCTFKDPVVTSAALESIADFQRKRAAQPFVQIDLTEHFRSHGFHFAPTNTGATKSQEGEHYKTIYNNKTFTTHMHLKKGSFRIYFSLEGDVPTIGAIGDHLPTAGFKE